MLFTFVLFSIVSIPNIYEAIGTGMNLDFDFFHSIRKENLYLVKKLKSKQSTKKSLCFTSRNYKLLSCQQFIQSFLTSMSQKEKCVLTWDVGKTVTSLTVFSQVVSVLCVLSLTHGSLSLILLSNILWITYFSEYGPSQACLFGQINRTTFNLSTNSTKKWRNHIDKLSFSPVIFSLFQASVLSMVG